MTINYAKHIYPRQDKIQIDQNQSIPGKEMVENNAGGYVFAIDKWKRLERFLILGSEGGTYYVNEKILTLDNVKSVQECIKEDGLRVIKTIVEISDSGRAPKNDPALFALALCASADNAEVRQTALRSMHKVARIGTDLYHFAAYMKGLRGWGRAYKNAIRRWYNKKDLNALIYQAIKYKNRDGWSHRDMLRLAHPKAPDAVRNNLYQWIVKPNTDTLLHSELIKVHAATQLSTEKDIKKAADLIVTHDLPRECVNTELLNEPVIWEALLYKMPLKALIRNLGKMSSINLIKPLSYAQNKIVTNLTDQDYLRKSRIHPLGLLSAIAVYSQGHGERGKLTWNPNQQVIDALNKAFYLSFGNVQPTNKRLMLCLDVSGSMTGSAAGNISGVSCAMACSALSLITANVESNYWIMGFADQFRNLLISPKSNINDVMKTVYNLSFGRTDCALPMVYALQNKIEVDTFVIYTDNETWCGNIHPVQALNMYRQKMGIPAKLVVVAMTPTEFSIADPNDSSMLDVVGFDISTPNLISEFAKE